MDTANAALDPGPSLRLVWAGVGQAWVWTAAGTILVVLLWTLSRSERRLVSRSLGWTLLALRIGAAGVLVLMLFEPIAERPRSELVRGRVVLGIDQSESMDTRDRDAPPRREIARRLLGQNWMARLRTRADVEAFAFAREAVPIPSAALNDSGPTAGLDRQTTDWTAVIEQALAESDRPILGVVLLTDGRFNGPQPEAVERAVAGLRRQGVPIVPVLIGSTNPPRDLAIAAFTAPEAVAKGQAAQIQLTIKADGIAPGTELPIVLERPGTEPLRQALRVPENGSRPVVNFAVSFETAGVHQLTAIVGPVADDARPDNDRASRTITVADDKARVLLVDGEARWEFQYLRNALKRDPRVTLATVVFHQPPGPADTATVEPTTLPSAEPGAPDPLGSFEVLILGDLNPGDLTPEQWERIERHVAERGGALVLASGPRLADTLAHHEVPARLLPVRSLRPVRVDPAASDPDRPSLPAGLRLTPTAEALAGPWPMLRLDDDPERNAALWASLPGLPSLLGGTPKPTATVLATAADHDAVLVAMPYGLGKVLWIGTNGTWRWRHRSGDAYHHRFWGQVVAWAARAPLTAGNRLVQFGAVPTRAVESAPVVIRARFAETIPTPAASLLVAARIVPEPHAETRGLPATLVPLPPRTDEPRLFEAPAPPLPPGRYRIKLETPQLAKALRREGPEPEARLEILPRETSERVELAASRETLDPLAAATGGAVLLPSEIDQLPDRIAPRALVRQRVVAAPLGDHPAVLLLFLVLLTAEWVLRKRAALP